MALQIEKKIFEQDALIKEDDYTKLKASITISTNSELQDVMVYSLDNEIIAIVSIEKIAK